MILTHSDLDGFVSAMLVSEAESVSRIFNTSYASNRDELWEKKFKSVKRLFITDLSINNGELEWARDGREWVWYDHHLSSLDFNTKGIFSDVIIDVNKSASLLIYDHYTSLGHSFSPNLLDWVIYANDRDLFLGEHYNTGLNLSFVIREIVKERTFEEKVLRYCKLSPSSVIMLNNSVIEKGLYEFKSNLSLAIKTAQTLDGITYCFCGGDASDIGYYLHKHFQIDGIYVFVYWLGGNIVVSLRKYGKKDDNINLSEIAKKAFNGGGHRDSAGGEIDGKILGQGFKAIHEKIMKYLEEGNA